MTSHHADKQRLKIIMDLERLNRSNAEGCPACGHKFSLGDTVVPACGAWEGGLTPPPSAQPRLPHPIDARYRVRSRFTSAAACVESAGITT